MLSIFELTFTGAIGEVGVVTKSVGIVVSSSQSICVLSVVSCIWESL